MLYKNIFVAIAANNFETLVRFYSNLLKLEPHLYLPNTYAEFSLKDLKIGIFFPQESQHSEFLQFRKSPISLCFEVENLEEAITHVTAMGYPPLGEIITASHGKEVYAYDPEGNRLILHQSGLG